MLLRTKLKRKKREIVKRISKNSSLAKDDLLFLLDENNGVPVFVEKYHCDRGISSWCFKGFYNNEKAFFKSPNYSRRIPKQMIIASFLRSHYSLEKLTLHREHENVIKYLGAFDEKELEFCLAYEFVDGKTLYQHYKEMRRFNAKEVVDLMMQTGEGLKYVHSKNIIHSDVSPGNLLLGEKLKLIDFGFAQRVGENNWYQQEEYIAGCTGCLAPEVLLDEKYSFASDIYGVGASFYFLIAGELPYPIKDSSSAPRDVVGDIVKGELNLEKKIFAENNVLAKVITKAVHKDVRQRYDCCDRMLDDLAKCL